MARFVLLCNLRVCNNTLFNFGRICFGLILITYAMLILTNHIDGRTDKRGYDAFWTGILGEGNLLLPLFSF